jgi:hypothetical protein
VTDELCKPCHQTEPMTDAQWTLNGGEVRKTVELMAAARQHGATLRVEVEWESLQRARADGLPQEREAGLLRLAWDTVIATLPPSAVGRSRRATWSWSEFVLEGDQTTLAPLGRRVVAALKSVEELTTWSWHLVFNEVFAGDPGRTFCCDVGYDLQAVKGRTAIVWARPYAGIDWRESQRYPTVTFLDTDP